MSYFWLRNWFCQTNPLGPLMHDLKRFRTKIRIYRDIRILNYSLHMTNSLNLLFPGKQTQFRFQRISQKSVQTHRFILRVRRIQLGSFSLLCKMCKVSFCAVT
jgi:hypothetical protein